jgi:capsular polysaccharide transport system permease protein
MSTSPTRRSSTGLNAFFAALQTQGAVIGALILRELQTRYGRDNVGYLWMICEPLMLATVISTLHYVGKLTHQSNGMQPFPFTVLGYCLFIIFRNVFNRADGVIEASTSMMYHRMITSLDILLVKAIVEICGCLSSMAVLMTVAIMLGIAEFPARPLYLFLGAFQMSWMALALSLIIAAYTYDSHILSRFVHPFSYFMVPLSGAFFTMSFLPVWAQSYMAWNPMMSIFETARYGWFETASSRYIYASYTIAVCACLTYWGLLAIRHLKARIHV